MPEFSSLSAVIAGTLDLTAPPDRPLFYFDLTAIKRNMRGLASMGRKYRTSFVMAVKSFPSEQVTALAADELGGFEYSNGTELGLVRAMQGKTLVYLLNRPYFLSEDILSPAAGSGSESIVILDRGFDPDALDHAPQETKFLIRIRSDDHKTFGKTRYGFEASSPDIPALIGRIKDRFEGFHFHYGSEFNSAEDYKRHAGNILELCRREALDVKTLDMGGGIHCIADREMDTYLAWLAEQFSATTRFIFEPGRALADNSGVILGRVLNRHQSGNTLNIVTTISPACHLRWSDPICIGSDGDSAEVADHQLNVLAPTCHESDRLRPIAISKRVADSISMGSTIRFGNVSGYSWALNTAFNGVPKASIQYVEL